MKNKININEDNTVFTYSGKIITQIVSEKNEMTLKAIEEYCEENNIIPNIISEEKLKLVLELGIKALEEQEKGE
jgi:nitrogen regulatory protein PII-like uncharacterized protein